MVDNVVLVGAPRSGASVFQSTLVTADGWGVSALSTSRVIDECREDLNSRTFDSHRLLPSDLTDRIRESLTQASESVEPGVNTSVDWHPRLSLRVGLLAAALPDARFVFVMRRPVPAISSLMEAWRSRRFAVDAELEGWWGEPWAFPVIPEWADLIGKPPADVCSAQWTAITQAVIEDLESLPRERWTVGSYEGLLADPARELASVCLDIGVTWTGTAGQLPATANAVSPPDATKWSRNWPEIAPLMPRIEPIAERLRAIATERRPDLEWPALELPKAPPVQAQTLESTGTPFASVHTPSVVSVLSQAGASLMITTYKSGHVIIARAHEDRVDTEFTTVNRPMGVATAGARLAIGASDAVLSFSGNAQLGRSIDSPVSVDVAYAPRSVIFTGDIAIHDMAYGADEELYFINTRFSCLCRLDMNHSFDPIWRPWWVTALAPEDRCHLNGLAMRDGRPRYVTALAQTDTPNGWRELKGTSGVIVDVDTSEILTEGLSMPHSPRWHDGRLWFLESGKGTLATVDIPTGMVTTVAILPGFTRGLSFIGPYAFVGLSQVRESVFTELPITLRADERNCGVWMVDTRTGQIVGFLKFDGVVQEIFEVAVLPGHWPSLVQAGPLTHNAFTLSDEALTQLPQDGK